MTSGGGKRPPLREYLSLFQATVAAEGITTGAGAATGDSIIDAALIGAGANSFDGMLAMVYPGQPLLADSMEIIAFNSATGEVTLDRAYKGVAAAIPAGVRYKILTSRFVTAELAVVDDKVSADMSLVTGYGSGSLANIAEATLCSLDAIGGTKKDVKVVVHIDAATAGNIEERWYVTSLAAPGTFERKYPVNAPHNPGAACVLTREFGDLPEGLQLQFRIDSAGNDIGRTYEVEMTHLN